MLELPVLQDRLVSLDLLGLQGRQVQPELQDSREQWESMEQLEALVPVASSEHLELQEQQARLGQPDQLDPRVHRDTRERRAMLGPSEPQEQLGRLVLKDQQDYEVHRESRVTPDQLVLQDQRAKWVKQAELATQVKLVRRVQSAARVLQAPLGHQEALERPVKLVQLEGPVPQA